MKAIKYIIPLCLLASCFGKKPTIDTGHEGKTLPSISLLLIDSSARINIKNHLSPNPVVLFYFSPDCPYCKTFTKNLIEDIKTMDEIQFFFLSNFPLNRIKEYSDEFQLQKYHNITIAQDYEQYFRFYFKAPGVPCLAIYNKEKILKQVLLGPVSTNMVKDIAFE